MLTNNQAIIYIILRHYNVFKEKLKLFQLKPFTKIHHIRLQKKLAQYVTKVMRHFFLWLKFCNCNKYQPDMFILIASKITL